MLPDRRMAYHDLKYDRQTPEFAPFPTTCPPGQELDNNLCFQVSQEQEEQQQQSEVTEEQQAVPVCQEGLEFNENLGFCVPTDCPVGQELNEESGICVLKEPEEAEESQPDSNEPEQPESEDSETEEENSNN
jgi:hypothetical protein